MKKKSMGVLSRWAAVLIVLAVLFAAGPVWAADPGPTQGQVALNLANLLGLTLPAGATEVDAITALAALGIFPCGIWNANAPADSNFIGCLYGSVQAAITAGTVSPGALGSASAHVLTGLGGRALRSGDVLPVGEAAVRKPRFAARGVPVYTRGPVLRVTAGPQADHFSGELCQAAYLVTEESNRMGLRLRGPAIPSPPGHMLTEGVPLGAVQVPPGGQPIILFVEHQTTGGYPKPANVISADFWRLGQLRPRDEVRFEPIGLERALSLLREQEQWLYSLL